MFQKEYDIAITSPNNPYVSTYSWKIPNFQKAIKEYSHNKYFYSKQFWVPYTSLWKLKVYPNGNQQNNFVDIFLEAVQTPYEHYNNILTRGRNFRLQVEIIYHVNQDSNNFDDEIIENGNISQLVDLPSNSRYMGYQFGFDNFKDYGYNRFLSFSKIFPDDNKLKEFDLVFHLLLFNDYKYMETDKGYVCKMEKFFENETLADIEIILDCDTRIKAHKVILIASSTYFEKMLQGGWSESTSDSIKIHNVGYKTFRVILFYLYGNKLMDINDDDLELLKDVYMQADMMGLTELLKFVVNRMCRMVNEFNFEDILRFCWGKDHCIRLKESTLNFISAYVKTVKLSKNMEHIKKSTNHEVVAYSKTWEKKTE
ncbi:BTB/POZ protein [Gigaspora rosea]|uniref:BTB/POZ protein n=1 Tax=Gigaspora rosea TaxID=44941 RepID=A0A397VXG6_9GLOM|nr:BTB/POZ protein [Gigaspora rosea]CAG8614031.1 10555_t:CDS:1 [Gigaspora rosea]